MFVCMYVYVLFGAGAVFNMDKNRQQKSVYTCMYVCIYVHLLQPHVL